MKAVILPSKEVGHDGEPSTSELLQAAQDVFQHCSDTCDMLRMAYAGNGPGLIPDNATGKTLGELTFHAAQGIDCVISIAESLGFEFGTTTEEPGDDAEDAGN